MRPLRLALGQIGDPAFRGPLLKGVAVSAALFVALALAGWKALDWLAAFEAGWLDTLVEIAGGLALVVLLGLLFPALVTAVAGLFLDDVAAAVEARHYPADPPGRPLAFAPGLFEALRFGAVALGLNLAALPFYLLSLWFPPATLCIFVGLNGYLLSREYFELVAVRHVERGRARRLRQVNQARLFWYGSAFALLLAVPGINLLAPVLATATMVHAFKALRAEGEPAARP